MNDPRVTHKYIQYIGQNYEKRDNLTGSGLVWEQGQVHITTPHQAGILLRHPMVFREVDEDVYRAQFGGQDVDPEKAEGVKAPWEDSDKDSVDDDTMTPARFCKLTLPEIRDIDYNQFTVDQVEAFFDYESKNKSRSGAMTILSEVVAAKLEGKDTDLNGGDL